MYIADDIYTNNERFNAMPAILHKMGWNCFSNSYKLKALKCYTFRILFPYYPHTVPGLILRKPNSFSPQTRVEPPSFKFCDDGTEIIGTFWIVYCRDYAKEILSNPDYGAKYSLVEIIVDVKSARITKWNVVQTLPCPRVENFKQHGGCCVM